VDNDNQQLDVEALAQPPGNNNQQVNPNLNEQSLFRFSTEGILPAWLPVPSFAFEVVRRETPALADNAAGGTGGLQRFFRRGGAADTNDGTNNGNQANDGGQGQQQQSFWRRLFVLAGAIPLTPEEEAVALDQLTDMFPQVSFIHSQIIYDCCRV
jgi:hypothetical protein